MRRIFIEIINWFDRNYNLVINNDKCVKLVIPDNHLTHGDLLKIPSINSLKDDTLLYLGKGWFKKIDY